MSQDGPNKSGLSDRERDELKRALAEAARKCSEEEAREDTGAACEPDKEGGGAAAGGAGVKPASAPSVAEDAGSVYRAQAQKPEGVSADAGAGRKWMLDPPTDHAKQFE